MLHFLCCITQFVDVGKQLWHNNQHTNVKFFDYYGFKNVIEETNYIWLSKINKLSIHEELFFFNLLSIGDGTNGGAGEGGVIPTNFCRDRHTQWSISYKEDEGKEGVKCLYFDG